MCDEQQDDVAATPSGVIGVPFCEEAFWGLAALQALLLLLIPTGYVVAKRTAETARIGLVLMTSMIGKSEAWFQHSISLKEIERRDP